MSGLRVNRDLATKWYHRPNEEVGSMDPKGWATRHVTGRA